MEKHKLIPVLFCLLVFISTQTVAQHVSVRKQRVTNIQTSHYYNNILTSRDSICFRYSGSRGSSFYPYDYGSDHYYGYNCNYTPEKYIQATLPTPMQAGHDYNVHFDSCFHFSIISDSVMLAEYMSANFKGNKICKFDYQHTNQSIHSVSRKIVLRNNTGLPQTVHEINYDTVHHTADTVSRRVVHHNYLELPTTDTIHYIDGSQSDLIYKYTYDAFERIINITQYRLTGSKWQTIRQYQLGYSIGGEFDTWMHIQYNDLINRWDTISTIRLQYDSYGRLKTHHYTNAGGPSLEEKMYTLQYNADGDIDTLTRYNMSQRMIERISFAYNSFHNPDSAYCYRSYDFGNTFKRYNYTRYYYEEYDDVLSPSDTTITIYPNPASTRVTIKWNEKLPQGPVKVFLYNSGGQIVREVPIQRIALENTIELRGIASGMYYMRIMTSGGGLLFAGALSVNTNTW